MSSQVRELTRQELQFAAMMGALFAHARPFSSDKQSYSHIRKLYVDWSGIFGLPLYEAMERLVEIMMDRTHMSSDAQTKALAVLPELQRIRLYISQIEHPAFTRVEHSRDGKPIGSMSSGILAQLDDVIGVARKSL